MGRARGNKDLQAAQVKRGQRPALRLPQESSRDRFASVLGTTRGSGRVELTPEQELLAREARLHREVTSNGDVRYYNYRGGELHRETGPAAELADGTQEWYQHGKLHREDDQPAIEAPDGTRIWYQHGERHREDGPALEWADGEREWYQHDELHRVDGPAIEEAEGTREWYLNGQRHRIGGPAVERATGTRKWYCHGELHRDDGPAVELANGAREWWLHGVLQSSRDDAAVAPTA